MNQPQLLHEPIAIVGMACRLPGADNLDEYWQLLREGRSAVEELPPERLNRELYFDPQKGVRGKTYSTIGGLVRERPLDSEVCPLDMAEQANIDPCHLVMCEVACSACAHAGYDVRNMPLPNTGVYLGHSGGSTLGSDIAFGTLAAETAAKLTDLPDFRALPEAEQEAIRSAWVDQLRQTAPQRNRDGTPDLGANAAASLISRVLGLTGPHMVLDAACASSVIALTMGALAVQSGQVDMALVGGASYSKVGSLILFSQAQSCSATGSRPFDDGADGLVSSEGYVALAIKTLARARADGDTIQVVLSGLGISADGRGRSLWAPREEGQIAAMQRAYSEDVRPEEVQYIEAHATSTQIGDATEMAALAKFYDSKSLDRTIPIGSVKSNIGHTLETAGLASFLKTILSIQHQVIPPTINIENLNREIPWHDIPFEVLTTARPWPEAKKGSPRRAGVNAFGIGGLNVHMVVDQFCASLDAYRTEAEDRTGDRNKVKVLERGSSLLPLGPLAIVGRGVVLPGASNVSELAKVLASRISQIGTPSSGRWRDRQCVRPGPAQVWQTPTCRGGFNDGYQFDWKKYRIPPKQIANANPLQFMLLDAAHQALEESGLEQRGFDRSTTGVVVGTLFGGEFGHQLVVGLRLASLEKEWFDLLQRRGFSKTEATRWVDQLGEQLVQEYPALIDETGSFTSSTLASRISKDLNFMGCALALDAGDCSALAAIDVASKLLQSGACSQVLCASGQRSMDLANYESLALQGRLPGSSLENPSDGFLPGEGAAAILLKRLADAKRDGDPVFGVIDSVASATSTQDIGQAIFSAGKRLKAGQPTSSSTSSSSTSSSTPTPIVAGSGVSARDQTEQAALRKAHGPEITTIFPESIGLVGHTMAALGMVETICSTLPRSAEGESASRILSCHTPNGQAFQMALSSLANSGSEKKTALAVPLQATGSGTTANRVNHLSHKKKGQRTSMGQIVRFEAESPDGLDAALQQAIASPPQAVANKGQAPFATNGSHRLAILFQDPESFEQQLALALKMWRQPQSRAALAKKDIFFGVVSDTRPRIALMFAGQGSQYPGMFADLPKHSPAAQAVLHEADGYLQQIAGQTYEQLCGAESQQLGSDIWATQASLVVADLMVMAWVRELGIEPDALCGHSFGEYAALSAAGGCSLEQIIRIVHHRTVALENHIEQRGDLVSLHASAATVESLIQQFPQQVYVTHFNAPEQTVVGGTHQAVAQFSEFAEQEGIVGHLLSVPCAFHTPLMAGAQRAFAQSLQNETLLPTSIPLLSSVTNRYLADPLELRENLVRQMVEPVRYLEIIERLQQDGIDLFIEMGPQQVLTRLNGQILAGKPHLAWATDEPGKTPADQALRLQAQLESAGVDLRRQPTGGSRRPYGLIAPQPIECFDATAKRKQQMRARSATMPTPDFKVQQQAIEQFDATGQRRGRNVASSFVSGSALAAGIDGEISPTKPVASAMPLKVRGIEQPPATSPGLEKFLVDFIVEQTGYPPEIIELDWDLEADLGIDSIKKAQLFGELREMFDFESTLSPEVASQLSLDQFRTLRSILELLEASGGKREWLAQDEERAAPVPQSTVPESHTNDAPAETSAERPRDDLQAFLIDFVVEQTGYPPEIVELDAEFEADLGIDSIKKAQLFGELREHFQLQVDSTGQLSLDDFRTVRNVLDVLSKMLSEREREEGPLVFSEAAPAPKATPVLNNNNGSNGKATSGSAAGSISNRLQNGSQTNGSVFPRGVSSRDVFPQGPSRREKIKNALYDGADRFPEGVSLSAVCANTTGQLQDRFSSQQWQAVETLAEETGLDVGNLAAWQLENREQPSEEQPPEEQPSAIPILAEDFRITTRRVLTTEPLPQLKNVPTVPCLSGAALVVGSGPVADELQRRLAPLGHSVFRLEETDEPDQVVRRFQEIWQEEPVPHLFFVGPREEQAETTWDESAWQQRRQRGIMMPFLLCQSWIAKVIEAGLTDEASLVATLSLGGDFGFSGNGVSAESGGVAGLLKAMMIENWMNGVRSLPIKLIDAPADEPPAAVVDAAFRELAAANCDIETGWVDGVRHVVRAQSMPLADSPSTEIRRGGNWIFTGGGRGITAHVAFELAKRYELRLHLIGTAPLPKIRPAERNLDPAALKQWKIDVMTDARRQGKNPIQTWQQQEKALEIDATLQKLSEAGISAQYYSCDVADRSQLAGVLAEIRGTSGSIDAIVHGAGVGKDARFENKQLEKVEQCFRAKVDGALALMALTKDDPLQFFVGFGSISGRFGANGHTDYSAANEMLAKTIGWYRSQRPEVGAVTFHWHAWGDVGMATKPETRLALEMIGMQFMPAAEGVEHLVRELEAGAPMPEVLITDNRYYRTFFPTEPITDASHETARQIRCPMLDRGETSRQDATHVSIFSLDPVRDPFLAEHRLDDRPMLPIVVGLEMLYEAAAKRLGNDFTDTPLALTDIEAVNGLRFHTDRAQAVRVTSELLGDGTVRCQLFADVCSRDGRLVEADRLYLSARIEANPQAPLKSDRPLPDLSEGTWHPIEYPAKGSKFFLGPALRCLRKIRVEGQTAWGRIMAPAPIELTGPLHEVAGWRLPCAPLDACLFATGLLAWYCVEPGTALPASIGRLTLGRLPRAGEACWVETQFLRREGHHAWFDFTLRGMNGEMILAAEDYRIVWLPSGT